MRLAAWVGSRGVARNFAWSLCGNIWALGANTLYTVIAARWLGDQDFGRYATAVSFVALCVVLGDLGITVLAVRDVARTPVLAEKYAGNLYVAGLALFGLQGIVGVVIVHLSPYDGPTRLLVYLMLAASFFTAGAEELRWCFQAFQRLEFEALENVARATLILVGGIAALGAGFGLVGLGGVNVVARGVILVMVWSIVRRLVDLKPRLDWRFVCGLLWSAIPLAAVRALATIWANADIVMLSAIKGYEAAGSYAAVNRVLTMTWVIGNAYVGAVYPAMASATHAERSELSSLWNRSLGLLVLAGVVGAVMVEMLAESIMNLTFGPAYLPAAKALRILIWSLPGYYVAMLGGHTLLVLGRTYPMMSVNLAIVLVNVGLNVALIPTYGYIGASVSMLVASGIGGLYALVLVMRCLRQPPARSRGGSYAAVPGAEKIVG